MIINKFNIKLITKLLHINEGLLKLKLPDNKELYIGKINSKFIAELDIHSWKIFNKIIKEGSMGFAEAYMNSEASSPDILKVIQLLGMNRKYNKKIIQGKVLYSLYNYMQHIFRPNSKNGSKKNISSHYDLGNSFYSKWLDKSMTYSSGIFINKKIDLKTAQENKYENLCKITKIQRSDEVLEVGCGWGGFAEYAAKTYGTKVTGLTISKKQAEYAKKRIYKQGLNDLVEIKIMDYRDVTYKYDKIISIEMFEAVGEKYWPVYFSTVRDRLKPGRNATLQIITLADNRWDSYRKSVDFIQKHIFPGGMLPSPKVLREQVNNAGLNVKDSIEFGQSYSATLRRWHKTFNAEWDNIVKLGFDSRFKNMWDFYLTSCAGTFLSGYCDVTQITISKPK